MKYPISVNNFRNIKYYLLERFKIIEILLFLVNIKDLTNSPHDFYH
jgi:hypothetical protein